MESPSLWSLGDGECGWRGLRLQPAAGRLRVVSMEPGSAVLGLRTGDLLAEAGGVQVHGCSSLPTAEGGMVARVVRDGTVFSVAVH